jgi:FKBP-type peptidyl-prolyl cis-trans isomerase FkpA
VLSVLIAAFRRCPHPPMRLFLPGLLVILLAGCGPATSGANVIPLEGITFAPALQVDLSQMERLASGVYVRDLVIGTGPQATRGTRVAMHYAGFLPDGTQVDSNTPPMAPFNFVIGEGKVIRGWDEGILGMRAGGQRQLVIPPSAGYGGSRVGTVPPNATLVFVVKLVSAR